MTLLEVIELLCLMFNFGELILHLVELMTKLAEKQKTKK
jgi:hypothetical protein